MAMDYEGMFLRALLATVAIETAVLWGLIRLIPIAGVAPSPGRILAAGLLCSAATLPYLWFVLPAWIPEHRALLAIGEPAVTVLEGGILTLLGVAKPGRAMALSLACNLVSFLAGLAMSGG